MVELAKTVDLDNLGFLFIGEAGSDPNEDFFSHLIQLFDIVVMHVLEFAIEFYSKEFELLDELNSGVISELEDSGVVDSAKSTYLGFGLVDGEALDAPEVLEDVKDLVQLLQVLLVPEGLEEQGQVISVPLSHSLKVPL